MSTIDVDEMRRLWSAGVSATDIADRYGITRKRVWRISERHEFPSRELPHAIEPAAPSPEDEAASGDSLRFSPWVAARIKELGLGVVR